MMEGFPRPGFREGEQRWAEGFNRALSQFSTLSPYVAAAKSGCDYQEGSFLVPLFNQLFSLSYPGGELRERGSQAPPPLWLHLLLLHYMVTADGTAVADSWVTYRYLPGALLFEGRFHQMAEHPLRQRFGQDIDGFRQAAKALGGDEMHRSGDAAFRFMALPHLPMGCVLYLGEEEIPASVSILFDASAPHYLPTEDLSYLGAYFARALAGPR